VPQSTPRERRPAGQTRARLLEVAVARVRREGLLLDYANIELEDLIREAGVPRSTVFRIWPDRVAFVADLVRALFEADPGFDTGFDADTRQVLESASGAVGAAGGREERDAALREALRVTVAHNMAAVEDTVAWRAYKTMSAALSSGDAVPGGSEIRGLLSEIEDRYLDRMAQIYVGLNAAFGLRMRAGVTERDLALAVVAMIDGMSDHRRINPAVVDAPRLVALGPEGVRDWHLAGVAIAGIYTAFTEPADA
jgi:AcrR family transcriptional regulator